MSSPFEDGIVAPSGAAGQHDASAQVPAAPPRARHHAQVPPPPAGLRRPPAAPEPPRRLHPAALGVWAIGGVRQLVFLVIAGTFNPVLAVAFVVVAAVASLARWWRFTWQVQPDALVIEQGILQRQRRVIPLERIQSVERVRKLGHRVFGVVELRVESIGSGGTEGQLDALDPTTADEVRQTLMQRAPAATGAATSKVEPTSATGAAPTRTDDATARPLVRMRPGQLVIAGVTGGRVGVFAALLGFASQAFDQWVAEAFEWLGQYVGGTGTGEVIATVAIVGAAAIVVSFLLSIVATTFAFWDFTLTRDDRNLYTTRGLLDQRSGTIPLHRVQSVRVEENLLRRLFGLASVKVEVAGRAGGQSEQETATVLPIGRVSEAFELAGTIVGRSGVGEVPLEPMPTGARDRRLVRAAVATVVATVPAVVLLRSPGVAVLPVAAALFGWLALRSYAALGHATSDDLILARSGVLVRTTHATLERALQAAAVTSTPFQRHRELATLRLHIARSPGGGGDPEIIDVDASWAQEELLRLARASTDTVVRQGPRPARADESSARQA